MSPEPTAEATSGLNGGAVLTQGRTISSPVDGAALVSMNVATSQPTDGAVS